ncbi:DsbA family protein [Leucobacter sp. USCH14]|uniref:DsbA family protein n=1 Tax=Leucobacter sp. USCH14 TaxID=3024838 RepID=UPI0030A7DAD2
MSIDSSASAQPSVEFWFDPICPWCWMTSRWVATVAEARGFEVVWHPVSLKIINEGNDVGDHEEGMRQGHRLGRVAVAAGREHPSSVVGELYTALGTAIHPGGRDDFDGLLSDALRAVQLDPALAAAADDEQYDAELRENSAHALKIAGPDVGVPVISVDGVAFFGPVVTPAPQGDQALQLWDGIVAAASVPGFYELKRGRTADPQF